MLLGSFYLKSSRMDKDFVVTHCLSFIYTQISGFCVFYEQITSQIANRLYEPYNAF